MSTTCVVQAFIPLFHTPLDSLRSYRWLFCGSGAIDSGRLAFLQEKVILIIS
jgi:hypothetical protein